MFSKTKNDIDRTLYSMMAQSIQDCRYNQSEAIKKTEQWIKQDRRFDGIDPSYLAREAFAAKNSGRQIRLEPKTDTSPMPPSYNGPSAMPMATRR